MTEQELRTSITPCIMAGNTWFVFDEIKAYAGAQVEASVARQQPIFEAAMNAKNTEIAELKADNARWCKDFYKIKFELETANAEIKRLRGAISELWNRDAISLEEMRQILSPAPVTHQPDILTKILALPDDTSAAYIKTLIHDHIKTA